MNEQMRELREEIERTLAEERQSYADRYGSDDRRKLKNIEGWIEALQYVLRQIEVLS